MGASRWNLQGATLATVGLLLSACVAPDAEPAPPNSVSDSIGVAETTTTAPVEKSAFLDFGAVSGRWVGVIGEGEDLPPAELELVMETEATRGTPVGVATYREPGSSEIGCEGVLSASRVDGNRYQLFQSVNSGPCQWNGSVTLLHSDETDSIGFRFVFDGAGGSMTGVLERANS